MKKNNNVFLMLLAIATLLTAVIGATYAYFASVTDGTGVSTDLDVEAQANTAQFTAEGGTFGFTVTGADMMQANAGSLAKESTGSLEVNLTSPKLALCTFDVKFAWNEGSSYTPTATLADGVTEFGVLYEGNSYGAVNNAAKVINFDKLLNNYNGIVLDQAKIAILESDGTEKTETINLNFKVQMYNLNPDQSALAGTTSKTYNGKFYIDNVECTETKLPLNDVILASNEIYPDNIASTYVTNATGIDFGQVSSDTNGKGVYYTNKNTENNDYTFYFRGDVANNYVKFGTQQDGTCSYNGNIIDTVYTINEDYTGEYYNGNYYTKSSASYSESKCKENNVCRTNGGDYIIASQELCDALNTPMDDNSSSSTFYNDYREDKNTYYCQYNNSPVLTLEFNASGSVFGVTGSTCPSDGNVCQVGSEYFSGFSEATCTGQEAFCRRDYENDGWACDQYLSGGTWLGSVEVQSGTFYVKDLIGASLSEKATYTTETNDAVWKVVRVNEDGSVRLILDSQEVVYEKGYYDYFTTSTPNGHINIVNTWYNNNLKTNYSKYLSDSGFCRDMSYTTADYTSQYGDTFPMDYYGSYTRIEVNKKPQYACPNNQDLLTTSSATTGSKTLSNPVGLISADEAAYAGTAVPDGLTLSIATLISDTSENWYSGFNYMYYQGLTGKVTTIQHSYMFDSYIVRPVINLSSNVKISSGDGTASHPYVVITE